VQAKQVKKINKDPMQLRVHTSWVRWMLIGDAYVDAATLSGSPAMDLPKLTPDAIHGFS
jgi:hypothetical protein